MPPRDLTRTAAARRRFFGPLSLLVAGALSLGGCTLAHATASTPPITGQPTLAITAPVQTVACSVTNLCVAAGLTTLGATIGQYRTATGPWRLITMPAENDGLMTSTSCDRDACFVGGFANTSSFLWRYTMGQSSAVALPHVPGVAIVGLSCWGSSDCVALIRDQHDHIDAARTATNGTTWFPLVVVALTSPAHLNVTCVSFTSCTLAAPAEAAMHRLTMLNPTSGQLTTVAGSPSWGRVIAAACPMTATTMCVVLAATQQGDQVVVERPAPVVTTTTGVTTTSDSPVLGPTWTTLSLPFTASLMSCGVTGNCLIAGTSAHGTSAVATLRTTTWQYPAVQYFPTGISGVSCGSSLCALVGASDVATVSL